MLEIEDLYVSLDKAREELIKRQNDSDLKKRIENELGENIIPEFKKNARGILWRSLPSPDNGFTFFYQCSKYINVNPLVLEYSDDKFVSINPEKKGLCELSVVMNDNTLIKISAVDINSFEGKKLSEVLMRTGERLVDFHHRLFEISNYALELKDITKWCHKIGTAKEYYYPYLLHFLVHGVLFEFFVIEEDERENFFTNNIIIPAIEKIQDKFGIKPLIIRLYPENQTPEEDFYWWSYPPKINDYLVDYARKNNLKFKECRV